MRVLLTTWAWPTHYFAMVPLGWAFAAAGHEVRVASQPALSEVISRSGLTATPVGRDLDLTSSPRLSPEPGQSEAVRIWLSLQGRCADLCEAMVDELTEVIESWRPDLVIWDWMTFAAPVAAARTGTRNMRLLFGPDFMTYLHGEAVAAGPATRADWPVELFDRYRLELDPNQGTWGAGANLDLCPSRVQLPGIPGMAVRYVPYNGPAVAPHPLLPPAERPRVCLTLGLTTIRLKGSDSVPLPDALDALADLDIDVVATVTAEHRSQLGAVPKNATVLEMCPLDPLLAGCSAIVHHGSAGTAMTAANRAVPQVVLPLIADQPLFAQQLAGAGAAIGLTPAHARPASLREAVTAAIEEQRYRDAARRLRDEIEATASPASVVATLAER